MASTQPKKHARSHLACLNFGPHTRLYSEDYFLQSLGILGLTRQGFRSWLNSMNVPMLEIGNTRFVDHLSLFIALRAILRVGQPTFLTPSSKTLKRGRPQPNTTTTLPPSYVEENLQAILSELLLAHSIAKDSKMSRKALIRTAREAAAALTSNAYAKMPATSRAMIDKVNARRVSNHPAFQSLPPPLPGGLRRPLTPA